MNIENRTVDLRSVRKIDVRSDCTSLPEILFEPFFPSEVVGVCVRANPHFELRLNLFSSSEETKETVCLKKYTVFHVSERGIKFPLSFSFTKKNQTKPRADAHAVVYLFGIE